MNESPQAHHEQEQGEDALRNVVEWSEDGQGQHNFLRIIADEVPPAVHDMLREHGYALVSFDDLEAPETRARLEELLVEAQSYMNKIKPGKIAVIVSRKGRSQVMQDEGLQGNWALNSQYMETFYL